jgi:hypothetical protein
MRFRCLFSGLLLMFALVGFAAEPNSPPKPSPPAPLLPSEFGGWQRSGPSQTSKDPATADAANAGVLKEYGFTDFASGSYKRDDGRNLTLRAARFVDASGAYGAFTFYKQPEMLNEKIGDQASSLNNRVLFYRGNVLIEALFDKLSVMSAAELRELASDIPLPEGGARKLPGLPTYLPKQAYVKNSAKYILGPLALDKVGAPIPAQLVDFGAGAEVVQAAYNTSGGEGTLMLVSYPTPQIAAEHLRRINADRVLSGQAGPNTSAVLDIGTFADKRTGPIVAIASGPFSQSEAKSLLASVNYEADVTWNENTFFDKKNNLANLLWNVILLCGAIMGITIVAGFAFGGARVLVRRMLPERAGGAEAEFIALHLDEASREPIGGVQVSAGSAKP